MKWHLLTVGKPALAYARSGVDEYLGRLRRTATVEWSVLKEAGSEANGEAQLARSSGAGVLRLVLDERGEEVRQSLRLIESESRRCGDLVKDLLSFARRAPVNIQPVEVNDVIRSCSRYRGSRHAGHERSS